MILNLVQYGFGWVDKGGMLNFTIRGRSGNAYRKFTNGTNW